MEISTLIAVISLLAALATLYLTQFRPPKLISQCGPFIKIYYADFKNGGSFGLYMPVTILNKSARTGTILNAAITLNRKDSPEQCYFMQWREFSKLDAEKNVWVFDEIAHALAISGRSSVAKTVWFMWKSDSEPKLILREGTYVLNFYFWDKKEQSPTCEAHEFYISSGIYQRLENYRTEEKATTTNIRLDRELAENRLMTEHEVKKLLE